jgi:hypothetical protein
VRAISDSTAPVSGTEFVLTYPDGSTYTAKSDAQGTVNFTNIPPGKATLTEKAPEGYTPGKAIPLDLQEGNTNNLPAAYQDNVLPVKPLPNNTYAEPKNPGTPPAQPKQPAAKQNNVIVPLVPIAGI